MIADFKPYPEYPEYKELGLPWLGPVPKHWDVRQARHIGRLFKGVGGTKEDSIPVGVACVRYGELYTTHTDVIRASKAFVSAEHAARYTPIQYGDVLFAASGETIEDIGKSAVNLMRTAAVCGGDIIVLRPSIPVHAPFLGYAMDCRPATNQKAIMGRGTTVKHIYPDELKNLTIPLPPPNEQEAIVRFIHYVDQRVNRLIKAKRRLIEVLNEQKQAIIAAASDSQHVTRALTDVWQIGHLGRVGNGSTPSRGKPDYWSSEMEAGYPWLNSANVNQGIIESSDQFVTELALRECHLPKVPDGSVLVAITGQGKTRGTAAILKIKATINQHLAYITPRQDLVSTEYLYLALTAAYQNLREVSEASGSTKGALTCGDLKRFKIGLPQREQQDRIVAQVRGQTEGVDSTKRKAQREIALIREYRTRLVSDVVTGQLDVRGLHLPDAGEEAPEVSLADEAGDLDDEVIADLTSDEQGEGEEAL